MSCSSRCSSETRNSASSNGLERARPFIVNRTASQTVTTSSPEMQASLKKAEELWTVVVKGRSLMSRVACDVGSRWMWAKTRKDNWEFQRCLTFWFILFCSFWSFGCSFKHRRINDVGSTMTPLQKTRLSTHIIRISFLFNQLYPKFNILLKCIQMSFFDKPTLILVLRPS